MLLSLGKNGLASLFKEVRVFKEFPHPENPGKLLKNYNLAHPGPVLKITENYFKITLLHQLWSTSLLTLSSQSFAWKHYIPR